MIPPHARHAVLLSVAIATLCSCQLLKKKADGDGADGAAAPGGEGGTATTAANEPALPSTFELVAVGKRSGSKIVWLKQIGDRVWLSGMGVDAFADGEGPLVLGSDLTQGLPQKPQEGWAYTGNGSSLIFALRYQADTYKSDDPAIISVRDGKGPWSSGAKVRHLEVHEWLNAYGLTPWKDGALYMYGQVSLSNTGDLTNPSIPGTSFQFVSPKGDIKDLTFDLPKDVMAWSADSDGTTLSLVGHRVKKGKSLGTSLFRGDEKGLTETVLVESPTDVGTTMIVREHGKAAIAYQTSKTPRDLTVYVVKDQAKEAHKLQVAAPGSGGIAAAAWAGGAVYASVVHKDHYTLSRVAEGAEPTPMKLPSLAKGASGFHVAKDGESGLTCEATDLFAHKNGIWVQASCSGQGMKVPAVFRLGHAQEPIALP